MVDLIGIKNVANNTKEQLLYEPKVRQAWSIGQAISGIKERNVTWKIGFAHMDADQIEVGDCVFLSLARTKCDLLVVTIPSDMAGRLQKKKFKFDLQERAFCLGSVSVVDYIVPYDQEDPSLILTAVNPDIIFKGRVENENMKWIGVNSKIRVEEIDHPFQKRTALGFKGKYFEV